MASKDSSYGGGASWADQWDYADETKNPTARNAKTTTGGKPSGMDKTKEIATAGFEKTKVIASVGFKKAKEGTSHGIQWIKEKYQQKRSQKK